MKRAFIGCACFTFAVAPGARAQTRLQSSDLLKLRNVAGVQLSPDATHVAYVVERNDGDRRPWGQLFVMTLADGKSVRFGGERDASGSPEWSPDGQWLAYRGEVGAKSGLVIAKADGSGARFIAEMPGTNAPLPGAGRTVAWSPDSQRIAFVSSVPGPETADATGDPVVITRYLYKPDAAEGHHALQRQPAPAPVRGRTSASGRDRSADDGHALRALDRLVAERPGDPVPHEPRRRRRRVLQLRHLRVEAGRQVGAPPHGDREQRVSAALVA